MGRKIDIKGLYSNALSFAIGKKGLYCKFLSLSGMLFPYCVALMPLLYLLNIPVVNVSLGTVLLLVFLPYSGQYIVRRFQEKGRSFNDFIGILLFALFYLYLCIRSDGNLSTIILALSTLVHMCGMLCGSVKPQKLLRILVTYAMISVGLVVIQTAAYYLLRLRIQYLPPAFVHAQFREGYIFRAEGGLFRPSALFLEPSHFTQYCCFALISVLFPSEGKADLERAIVIAIGCILTTSGMGIVLVCGIAAWYFVVEYLVRGKIKTFRPKQILITCLILAVGAFCVCQIPFVKTALQRVFSTVDGYNAIVGRLGLWKLKDAIGKMDLVSLLFGYGNSADYGYYLTGLADTIYKQGLVGVILEVACFGWLMYRKRSNYVWGTSLTFLLLFVVAHLTSFFLQIFYFGLVIAEVAAVKKPAKQKKEVTPEQVKAIAYDILVDVADFCERNRLQYSLACGTALGAIRHGGFIPWDDDVDICMPRPDYERFLDMYISERYALYDTRYQKNYPYPFAKVCDPRTVLIDDIEDPCKFGVYIDVFPIDGLPDGELQQKKYMKKLGRMLRVLSWKRMLKDKKMDILHKLILLAAKSVLHIVPIRFLLQNLERTVQKYSYTKSDYVGHVVSPAPWGSDIKPKVVFENPVRHVFEDREFFVPGDADKYLTLEYGDYMQLPPEEKRVAKHDFVAYYK